MYLERLAKKCICCEGVALNSSSAILMPFIVKRIFNYDPVEITEEWGLRDIQKGIAYYICRSLQCQSCGVLFLDLRFTDDEMKLLYSGYRDENYTVLREQFEPGYKGINEFYSDRSDYLEKVEKFLKPYIKKRPTILDWGGDTGANTPLKNIARQVHVYDISKKETVEGVSSVNLADIKKTEYDLIVCSQVLEHVSHPLGILDEIVPLMGAETVLYLEVPFEQLMQEHMDKFDAYKYKHHWHEHINFFTRESIVLMLNNLKLDLVEMQYVPISLGWRDSCLISVICKK